MKLVSWNVNGLRSMLGQNASKRYDTVSFDNKLFKYIESEKPDIISLQETKAEPEQIIEELRTPPGYMPFYNSCKVKKGYSGVVTYTKIPPKKIVTDFSIPKFDNEGRFIQLDFDDFVLMNIYFPNGTSGRDRVDYKLEFYDALFVYIEKLRKKGRNLIICGDYNTAHKEIDLARPRENEENSGFLPEERVKIDWLVGHKYVDTFRAFCSEGGRYTWWSQRGRARENNIGWRIDYHFVTEAFMKYVKNSYHQTEEPGSDHCPIVLELNL